MTPTGYVRTIRKNWWLILIAVVLGAVGGLLMTARATAMYQSSVTFYVSTPSDAAGGNAYQANQYAVAKIESYTKLLNSDALASRIIAVTDVDLTPAEVSSRISSSSGLNTVLLTATVTDSSAERALSIAGAIGSEFGPLVDGLDNRTDEDGRVGSTVKLNVISGPTVNPDPVSPNAAVNLALGVLAGLLLGVGLAILRGLLDTTIRSADALEEFTGLPSLGRIPLESSRKKSSILIGDQLRSVRAEAYRQIRTNLQFMDLDDPIQVLVVASSVPGEGKSTTAANLAIVTAETGRRVLLIEADMRRPRVADYLGLERAVGLSNVLVGQLPIDGRAAAVGHRRADGAAERLHPAEPVRAAGQPPDGRTGGAAARNVRLHHHRHPTAAAGHRRRGRCHPRRRSRPGDPVRQDQPPPTQHVTGIARRGRRPHPRLRPVDGAEEGCGHRVQRLRLLRRRPSRKPRNPGDAPSGHAAAHPTDDAAHRSRRDARQDR